MKKLLLVTLFGGLLPLIISAQRGKNLKYSSVHIAATFNYYPPIEPYTFFREYLTEDQSLILTFKSQNAGTFVIEDQEPLEVERSFTFDFPSQIMGFGISMQIVSDKSFFQELSIAQFSILKSETTVDYKIRDDSGDFSTILLNGETQRTSVFGLRYEYGKYFGNKKSPVRFGISLAVEPTFYKFKMIPKSIQRFPVTAKITTIDFAIIPALSIKLAKKVTLDVKLLPNFLVADFESVVEEDPRIPKVEQRGERNYNLPEIDLGFSLVLRCMIKEPKRRSRRKG